MCQLLGINSLYPASLAPSFLEFSARGGLTDHHADGWGVAFFEPEHGALGRRARTFIEIECAARSALARMIGSTAIHSHNAVAHLRRATVGPVALENNHPFTRRLWGRDWAFAHNGHLHDFAPQLDGSFTPAGATDSELAFCTMMQTLARSNHSCPSLIDITHTLHAAANEIGEHGEFNFLLSNGTALWARASTNLFHASLVSEKGQTVIVATEPLASCEGWSSISPGEIAIFVDGRRLHF